MKRNHDSTVLKKKQSKIKKKNKEREGEESWVLVGRTSRKQVIKAELRSFNVKMNGEEDYIKITEHIFINQKGIRLTECPKYNQMKITSKTFDHIS